MATHMLSGEVFHRLYWPFLRLVIALCSLWAPGWAGLKGMGQGKGRQWEKE